MAKKHVPLMEVIGRRLAKTGFDPIVGEVRAVRHTEKMTAVTLMLTKYVPHDEAQTWKAKVDAALTNLGEV